ncbi:MAG: hypothetical protein D6737_11175 [Chloroflexi bacterium]|nr:MAG: hypothetical protein D6737_11175 [Chloroflexota bacterium]
MLILNYTPNQRFYHQTSWYWMENGRALRWFITFMCAIIAWKFSTYDYNYYLNQEHFVERILLILLVAGVYLSPATVPVFTAFSIIVIKQLEYPLGLFVYSWTDKSLVFAVLILFIVYLYVRAVSRVSTFVFVFLMLCLIGSYYFIPGASKIVLGPYPWSWLVHNRLDHLFVSSYLNGWFRPINESTILSIASMMRSVDVLFRGITLVIEAGAIILLLRQRLTLVFIAGFILLHTAIFISSGIFFWKWILLDSAVLVFVYTNRNQPIIQRLYTWQIAVLSVFIILFSKYYFSPIPLGWFDANVNQTYQLEALTTTGETYPIARSFMAPYDLIFSQARYHFLNPSPTLINTYGTIFDFNAYIAISTAQTPDIFSQIAQSRGQVRYDATRAAHFDSFMQIYFCNLDEHERRISLIPLPPSFQHILTFSEPNHYRGQSPVEQIQVRYMETFYQNGQIETTQSEIVRIIDIDCDDLPARSS